MDWQVGDTARLNKVEELHVDTVGKILGLTHEGLEVLTGAVLGSSHIASLVVVLLCTKGRAESKVRSKHARL